jgi:hypothetical protein
MGPSKATRRRNPSPRRHLLLLRPLPSLSHEAPAGQARDAGEGDGGDLLSELLVRRLGGELPGGELGSAAGCCSGLPPLPPAWDVGKVVGVSLPRPWQGSWNLGGGLWRGGVVPAAGDVRWVLQAAPSAMWTARWRRMWGVRGYLTSGQI